MQSIAFDGQAYKTFIEAIRAPKTRDLYNHVLKKYMRFCNVSSVDALVTVEPRLATSRVIDFIVSERNNGLTYGSLNAYLAALKKFYELNEVVLNWKKVKQYLPAKNKAQGDRAYRHEEIRRILELATDIRRKIIVLLCCSAGLRIGAISDLKLRHIEKIEQYGVYKIIVYERAAEQYFTFCTPECGRVIDDYLAYRKQYGENLTPNSPLLRNQFDKRDIASVANVKPLNGNTITTFVHLALVDAGLRKPAERTDQNPYRFRYDTMQSHGMRKFFFTNLLRAGVEPIAREYLMGHKHGKKEHGITELMMVYARPEENELFNQYLKGVDLLTINEENRLKLKVVQLESDNQSYADWRQKHDEEMKKLREEMEEKFRTIVSKVDVSML